MNHRRNAIILGVFYILAAVSSVVAVLLYQPIMEENWYGVAQNNQTQAVLFGVLFDVLLLISVASTAIILAPYLTKTSRRLSLAYLVFRLMEGVFIAIGLVAVLVLVTLSQAYDNSIIANNNDLMLVIGAMLQGFHRWIMVLGPNLMLGINTMIYSYLLYQSRLVPRSLAIFGMVVSVMVFMAGIFDFFGYIEPWSTLKGLVALPLGVYEISLAIYLIVKGFKAEALTQDL